MYICKFVRRYILIYIVDMYSIYIKIIFDRGKKIKINFYIFFIIRFREGYLICFVFVIEFRFFNSDFFGCDKKVVKSLMLII